MILDPKDTTDDLKHRKTEDFRKDLYKMNEVLTVLEAFSVNYEFSKNFLSQNNLLNLNWN